MKKYVFVVLSILFFLSNYKDVLVTKADSYWTVPQKVFETSGVIGLGIGLTADPYGGVHAVWGVSEPIDYGYLNVVYYTRLDGYNQLVQDALVTESPTNSIDIKVGHSGLLTAWYGGNYTYVPFSSVGDVKSWIKNLVQVPIGYPNSSITKDRQGNLWEVWGEKGAIYVAHFDEKNKTWTDKVQVFMSQQSNSVFDAARLSFSEEGYIHVVWAEYSLPSAWPPLGLYYSNSKDGGETWSSPLKFADGEYNQPNVLAGSNGKVYIAWVGASGTGGKYFQFSEDGGLNWSRIFLLTEIGKGGSAGAPVIIEDQRQVIHLLYADNHLFYQTFDQGELSEKQCLSCSLTFAINHLEYPAMVLSGNVLYVLFETNQNTLWTMSKAVDIQASPFIVNTPHREDVVPVFTPVVVMETLANPADLVVLPTVQSVYWEDNSLEVPVKNKNQDTGIAIAWGLMSSGLFIVLFIAFKFLKNK